MREQVNNMLKHANRVAVIYKTVAEEITTEWIETEIETHSADICEDVRAVYVGTWHKYNNGSLYGLWIDVDTFEDADEFLKFCRAIHADEEDPELMFQDTCNIPEHFTDTRTDSFFANSYFDFTSNYGEDEQKIICEYWNEVYSETEPAEILDCFVAENNFEDFADEIADMQIECIQDKKLRDFIAENFDYEKHRENLSYYNTTTNYIFFA